MRRLTFAVALLVGLSSLAIASAKDITLDVSGLSESQIAQIQSDALARKARGLQETGAVLNNAPSVDRISEYAKLGKDLGVGLASTAKELGVAANEFAQTPLGHVAMLLIIYKVIGSSIIHLICGFLWLTSSTAIFIYFFRRMFLYESIITNYDPTTGKRINVVRKPMDPTNGDVQGGRLLMGCAAGVSAAMGLIITFTG